MDTLLETSDLWVLHQPGASGQLWLSFAGREDRRPSAPGFISGEGGAALHFVSKTDDWFQSLPLRAVKLVEEYRRDAGRLVSFGQSMGAFAALATARAFRPDIIIGSAPQIVIDPDRSAGRDSRWAHIWRTLNPGVGSDAREGMSGAETHIFYDPRVREDRWHVSLVRDEPGVHLHRLPGAGHATFHQLKELGLWREYMRACLRGPPSAATAFIQQSWRSYRRHYLVAVELGFALHLRGENRRAERVLRSAITIDPSHHKGWIFLYFVRRALGDLPGALEAARGAARQVRGREELWTLYTDVMSAALALGDQATAVAALEEGLEALPACTAIRDWLRSNNGALGLDRDVTTLSNF